jgi:predicted HicB family RNase H-like nuclease
MALPPERPPSPFQAISVRVTPALRQQVQEAAQAMGIPVSRWLGNVVQHVTPEDFPASWQPGAVSEAS